MRFRAAPLLFLAALALASPVRAVTPAIDASDHRLALKSDGTLVAWGNDGWGQLGMGRLLSSTTPVAVTAIGGVTAVAAGSWHAIALRSDGTVWAWGDNSLGQLGNGTTAPRAAPVRVPGLNGIVAIAANAFGSMALRNDGTVWVWGVHAYDQIGYASTPYSTTPRVVNGLTAVTAIAAGSGHWMALKTDKTVWCWGAGDAGQMGNDLMPAKSPPVQASISNVVAIAAGGEHSVALKADGTVWSWGDAFQGALGDNVTHLSFDPIASPTQAVGLTDAIAIASSADVTLALRAGRTVVGWGPNQYGTVGNGTGGVGFSVTGPVFSGSFGTNVKALAAGSNHALAVKLDGTLLAVGRNASGQLGDGSRTDRFNAVTLPGVSAQAAAAGLDSTVVVKSDGTLLAFGDNLYSQLGDGVSRDRSTPIAVPGVTGVVSIGAGGNHSLAVKQDGTVLSWGSNANGQLGDPASANRSTPAAVPGLASFVAVSAGDDHSMALASDGTVWTWGMNNIGQIGNGTTSSFSNQNIPYHVPGLDHVVSIAAGSAHSVALRDDGTVWLWGEGGSPSPTQVGGIGPVSRIAAGLAFTVALRNDGTVWSWGDNSEGTLCDGTTNSRSSPAPIAGVSGAVAVGARSQAVWLLADGTIRGCGLNLHGELGDTTTIIRKSPVAVANFQGIAKIAAGYFGTFAMRSDGVVFGWGMRAGDGTYVDRSSPAVVVAPAANAALDLDNWYLDLDPSNNNPIPPAYVPGLLVDSRSTGDDNSVTLSVTSRYKAAEIGTQVQTFVLGLVPPSFLSVVQSAPGSSDPERLQAKAAKAGGLVLVQLTPAGWSDVNGQLIASATGTASAAGNATNILDGLARAGLSGSRFCIGYGATAQAMLSADALREVLLIGGASSTVSGSQCVLAGIYVGGPATSLAGSAVTFSASVVGLGPAGTVQFKDGFDGTYAALGSPVALAASNPAVSGASITTSSLAAGSHSIAATYSGDGPNPASTTDVPKLHVVLAQPQVMLEVPASSTTGKEIALVATVTGNSPGGTVLFMDGGTPLGTAAALVEGVAILRTTILPAGSHAISAAYSGDAHNAPATSASRTHVVASAINAQVAIASNANPAAFGAGITLTVTVTGATPTGSVTLRDLGVSLGSANLAGGHAGFSLGALAGGLHRLTADYAGDDSNAPATSPTFFQEVAVPAPTFLGVAASRSGAGSGSIASSPAGIDCGAACSASFVSGSTVTLSATPSGGSVFVGWSGACAGSGNCTLSMTAARSASARFEPPAAGVAFSPASLDFGAQSMNTTSLSRSVTLTNNSGAPIDVSAIESALGFVATHDCVNVAAGATCTIIVGYTPGAQGASTATVALFFVQAGVSRVAVIPVAGAGERSLAAHYYQAILRREPDAGGKAYWDGEAARLQSIGANINEAWFAMAQFFYSSAEYTAFNRDSGGFVTDLYTTFFNRAPDPSGMAFWTGLLAQGMPREVVLASFMFSNEFVTFTQSIFGNTAARAEVDAVMDFYRGLLARTPDPGGFDYWVARFRAAQCVGSGAGVVYAEFESISSQFASGSEYTGKNRTNAQYVGDLYNAFLRRGGDLGGVQYWIGQLDGNTLTRNEMRQDFIATPEFQTRLNGVVAQGCLP